MTVTEPTAPDRLGLASLDVAAERVAHLREDFPEVFREDRIDFEALQRSLGAWVDPGKERFGLTWPGKANCMRVVQQPSVGTLVPDRAGSVDFDATGNVIIEGENLEVLKLLQKSYYGKVKMIYIDPPYNTGNEFIYPDNFAEPLAAYLRLSGQTDGNGQRLTTNTETEGRYHSNWLNMMYPRLFLARNLLREDGVIFVSIDDHELQNLRLLMNELFGEENFLGCVTRVSKKTSNKGTHLAPSKDYVAIYGRDLNLVKPFMDEPADNYSSRFDGLDERGAYATVGLYQAALDSRPNQRYWVECPDGSLAIPPGNVFPQDLVDGAMVRPESNSDKVWRWSRDAYNQKKDLLVFKKTKRSPLVTPDGTASAWNVYTKYYLEDRLKEGIRPRDFLDGITNDQATIELKALGLDEAFSFAKPAGLVERLLTWLADPEAVVLDFFAGSGTTGHAIMQLNAKDGGSRRFILVQLPEPAEGDFTNIAQITRERIRRAAQAIAADRSGKLDLDSHGPLDLGFRSYRLTDSNFVPWSGAGADDASVARQIELIADNLVPDRTAEDILTEVLLKAGYELTVPVERLDLAGQEVFSVADGALLVCLERPLTIAVIEAMAARDPAQIVCLDAGFGGDDALKVNAVQTVKARPNTVFKVV